MGSGGAFIVSACRYHVTVYGVPPLPLKCHLVPDTKGLAAPQENGRSRAPSSSHVSAWCIGGSRGPLQAGWRVPPRGAVSRAAHPACRRRGRAGARAGWRRTVRRFRHRHGPASAPPARSAPALGETPGTGFERVGRGAQLRLQRSQLGLHRRVAARALGRPAAAVRRPPAALQRTQHIRHMMLPEPSQIELTGASRYRRAIGLST